MWEFIVCHEKRFAYFCAKVVRLLANQVAARLAMGMLGTNGFVNNPCVSFAFLRGFLLSFSFSRDLKCCAGVQQAQIWVSPTWWHPVRKAQIRLSNTGLQYSALSTQHTAHSTAQIRLSNTGLQSLKCTAGYVFLAGLRKAPGNWVRAAGKQRHAVF